VRRSRTEDLGLNFYDCLELTAKLNEHTVKQATKLIRTRYMLQNNRSHEHINSVGRVVGVSASAHNPPDSHYPCLLIPRWAAGVVQAPASAPSLHYAASSVVFSFNAKEVMGKIGIFMKFVHTSGKKRCIKSQHPHICVWNPTSTS